MELGPTQLLTFGNPRGGTPLMRDRQTVGLDLPVRALAWEDPPGAVWLSYDDPHWLAIRDGLGAGSDAALTAIGAGMQVVAEEAVRQAV